MDLYVLDTNRQEIAIIDSYKSFIWTDRYNEYGDFELYTPMSLDALQYIRQGNYLCQRNSDHAMIIEKILIESNVEDGDVLTVSGRSLESILDRRIVWGQKTLTGDFQTAIKTLLTENIISPSNTDRTIPDFIFEETTDSTILNETIEAQYTGDNLYDIISALCSERGVGFRIIFNDSGQFVFSLYSGVDRTYKQLTNPYVVFSPKFDNIISGNYMESKQTLKNVALVGGDGEGSSRKYTAVGNVKGLNRREIFADAQDVSKENEDGEALSDTEYVAQLRQRGKETLSENRAINSFEGEAETTILFKHGVDFFTGDIVQVADNYGNEGAARITEVITSHDENGMTMYSTFETIEVTRLPSDYLELEFIRSTGTQYIDTGFAPNNTTRVVMDMVLSEQISVVDCIFGARDTNYTYAEQKYAFFTNASGGSVRSDYFGTATTQVKSASFDAVGSRITVDKNQNECSVTGESKSVELSHDPASGQCASTLYLCCMNTAGSAGTYSKIKIYSMKIYDNGVLVRDYVPCKNEDDKVGLYDLVTETFYSNSGTGAFEVT